jgi:hypothetical protein
MLYNKKSITNIILPLFLAGVISFGGCATLPTRSSTIEPVKKITLHMMR